MSDTQLQQLIGAITQTQTAQTARRTTSFATATFTYDGERDVTRVKTFLTAASCFKRVEKMTDGDALDSLPLILKDDAAVWWNGVADSVSTWDDFKSRLHRAFAPKKPAPMIYQELVGVHQKDNELTETFVATKRDLIAQLPTPRPSESIQLDMVHGSLHKKIREKVLREMVTSFDDLLTAAQSAEELFDTKPQPAAKGRIRCSYCKNIGHSVDVCRKKKFAESKSATILIYHMCIHM
ncbi:activity-regulated cytoskeleton associated protein 2-like [Leguminivora glycinivorella]|uniref:activity-regulated cytoskeleton associated protein 2-like n=1 Tax=Leguminivora glycinivorella TaxID=1035111 RepID=UPI00200C2706|nr:activity-regulated cytoskeleton associated protein 2-like [Leguminivora glycinivorella]